jgi:hypothetical protein
MAFLCVNISLKGEKMWFFLVRSDPVDNFLASQIFKKASVQGRPWTPNLARYF